MKQFFKDWIKHESFPFFLLAIGTICLTIILSLLHICGVFP